MSTVFQSSSSAYYTYYEQTTDRGPKVKRRKLVYDKTEQNGTPSATTFNHLLLEVLDFILYKSYLHWILNSPTKQRDEEVIRSLMSVDVCFYRRITRRRFKKAVWRYLKVFYWKGRKRFAIIRNNRNYLLENIQPNDELIASLLSLNCITSKEIQLIQRQSFDRDKNDELLNVMRSFNEERFSNCMKCLRQTKQNTVARIIENGGVAIQVVVQIHGGKCTTSMDTQPFHQGLHVLLDRTKPWSHETNKLIGQLRNEGIEIVNSQLDRQTAVVWIWCRSQSGLDYIRRMYESKQLKDILFSLASYQPSESETILSMVISIDSNDLRKTVVVCEISSIFTKIIEAEDNEYLYGLTKLRNEIYVLSQGNANNPLPPPVMRVYEDQSPFRLQRKFELNEIEYPRDMVSSEQNNCLYVSDVLSVWKIAIETNNRHKIIKWLTTDSEPSNFSVSADGQLLIEYPDSPLSLKIYGSDAECIRSIQLKIEIGSLQHAVKTSVGNFVILHDSNWKYYEEDNTEADKETEDEDNNQDDEDLDNEYMDEEDEDRNKREEIAKKQEEVGENRSGCAMDIEKRQKKEEFLNGRVEDLGGDGDIELESIRGKSFEETEKKKKEEVQALVSTGERNESGCCLSEFTGDGQLLIRRFIPENEAQQLRDSSYLALNSDDQVFVADTENHRVILFDADLKWNQIVCPTTGEGKNALSPKELCYDAEKKQLLVGTISKGVHIYTLDRK